MAPLGCARRINLNGGGVKLRGFADSLRIQWRYEVLLTSSFNAYHWLIICKTPLIKNNNNEYMKFR